MTRYKLLEAVPWHAYTDSLSQRLGPDVGTWVEQRVRDLAGTVPALTFPRHTVLAVIVQASPTADVRFALNEVAPDLDVIDQSILVDWLVNACAGLLDVAEGTHTAAATPPAMPGPLVCPMEHEATLPLQALCDDIARLQGLTIILDMDMISRGSVDHQDRIIRLNPRAGNIGEVLAHELGHLLDPACPRPLRIVDEDFADVLAALLRLHEPATVADAQPLIRQALNATPDQTLPGMPDAATGSLLALLDLPLTKDTR